jgi:hypothetical protein
MKGLKIEFQGRDRCLKFVGDRIDEVALPTVQIDVLDDPDQIQNDTDENEHEDDRADTQQDPVNAAVFGGCGDGVENIEEYPSDGQTDNADDHEDRQEDRPCEALSFKHLVYPFVEWM